MAIEFWNRGPSIGNEEMSQIAQDIGERLKYLEELSLDFRL